MARTNPKRRCVGPPVATRSPSPSPQPSAPSHPPEDSEAAAVLKYLKAQGFSSALAALTAELADADKKRRDAARLSIPNLVWGNEDIVAEIVSFLGMSDLRTCLSVSKTFYRAAAPRLYRCLRVRHLNCHCRPPPDRDTKLVARYTTAVELFPHHHVQHYLKLLDLPRLRTLILNHDTKFSRVEMTDGKGSSLHKCKFCPGDHPTAPRVVVRPIAGLFKGLKPVTVIAVPTQVGWINNHPPTVAPETVVHVARMTSQTKYSRMAWGPPRKPVAAPTRTLTFVLLPIMWDHGPVGKRPPPWGEAKSVGNLGSSLIDALSEFALVFGDHAVNIVGLEDANPFAKKEHWDVRAERREVFEKAFADKLDALMVSGYRFTKWSEEERGWRRGSVTLTTFNDYLRSGVWGEEMDWQLVGRWLNTYELREQDALGTLARKSKAKGRGRKRKLVIHDSDAGSDDSDGDYTGSN